MKSKAQYKQNGQNISIWGDDFRFQGLYDGKEFKIGKGDEKGKSKYELSGDSLPQEEWSGQTH